jgi:serine/threonine protein kinase
MLAVGSPESQRAGLTPNLVIANRFQLARKLGEGGMGCVWTAHHLTLGIDVAVKFIDGSLVKSDEVRSRFAQEAMAAARIKSPHVVNILDYGTDDTGRPYIAMEMLEGEDLSHRLEREGTLSVAETARVIAQACRGLSKAHAAGIVHRDLKPENLFLCEDDDGFLLKILDFGIAKAQLASGVSHKTALGAIVGTPAYMSPEQAQGEGKIDHRSDLYSLATVAYHALVGEPPFPADNLHALLVGLIARPAPPVSLRQPHLSTKYDAWFAKALAKAPSKRFQTARDMAESFVTLTSSAGPPVEDWSFTGSEIRAVQPVISAPADDERALGLLATVRPSELDEDDLETHMLDAGDVGDSIRVVIESSSPPGGTLRGLGDNDARAEGAPAEDDEDDETVVEPHPELFRHVAALDDDDEDDDETEVGGYFSPEAVKDRLVIAGVDAGGRVGPVAQRPPSWDEDDSSSRMSQAGPEAAASGVARDDEGQQVAGPVEPLPRWTWAIALLAVAILAAGATAALAVWLAGW